MNCFKKFLLALLAIFFSSPGNAIDKTIEIEPLPKKFSGSWIIKSVHLNVESGRRRYYEYDDPELVGRRFKFSEKEIYTNASTVSRCIEPKAGKWVNTANKLLDISMGRNGYEEPGEPAVVENFELPLNGNATVTAFILTCKRGSIGPSASDQLPPPMNTGAFGTWMVFLNNDEIIAKWLDDTILFLRREGKRQPRR